MHIKVEELSSMILNDISERRGEKIKVHLNECRDCKNEADHIKSIIKAMEGNKGLNPQTITKSDSCPDDVSLFKFAESKLSRGKRKGIESHLAHCDYCRHLIAGYIRDEAYEAEYVDMHADDRLTERLRRIYVPFKEESVSIFSRIKDIILPDVMIYRYALAGSVAGIALLTYLVYNITFPTINFDAQLMGKHTYSVRGIQEVTVDDGDVLYSGDSFYVKIDANRDMYAYVLLLDSNNNLQWIFPNSDIDFDNYLEGGSRYLIPPDSGWLLDENKGTEVVFILGSTKRISELNKISKELKEDTSVMFGGKSFEQQFKEENIEYITNKLKEHFRGIKVVRFEHR